MGYRSPAACARSQAFPPSSCYRPRARTSIASLVSKSGPTTTCPSPSIRANCWRASAPCCGGRKVLLHRPWTKPSGSFISARSASISMPACSPVRVPRSRSPPASTICSDRKESAVAPAVDETIRQLHFGPFSVNLDARMLTREGAEIALTTSEYDLLEIFVTHDNRALSRDWLMDQLRGFERDPFDRSIDVRVNRLRKKIEDDPANPAYIRTQRGQGYLFVPQGKG